MQAKRGLVSVIILSYKQFAYIYETIEANDLFKTNCKLNYIKVWESPKAAVIYRKDA